MKKKSYNILLYNIINVILLLYKSKEKINYLNDVKIE